MQITSERVQDEGQPAPAFAKRLGQSARCGNPVCQKPLSGTWEDADGLCCECGLDYELSHPETRWEAVARAEAPRASGVSPLAKEGNAVRAKSAQLRAVRLGLRALGAVAPATAEAQAARMFFRPRRAPRRDAPNSPGLATVAFRVISGEYEIACWSWGRGPVVMLVHGWEGYAAQLAHLVGPLVAAGFRPVTFDFPAHGASTGRELTVFDMARVVRAVAEVSGPVHAMVAHSLGSAAAVLSLVDGLEVSRVVLLAPAAEPTHFARVLAALVGLSGRQVEGMMKRIEARLGRGLNEVNAANLVGRLDRSSALVLHDPADPEVPFEHGKAIAEAWPGALLVPLSGMGHRRMLRDAGVIRTIAAFVAAKEQGVAASRVLGASY